jgi:hypothetical protein
MWNVGADSIYVVSTPTCYANCDASTISPFLNVNDFLCFMNLFAAGEQPRQLRQPDPHSVADRERL